MTSQHLLVAADVFDGVDALPPASVDAVCTSVPYWGLRSYFDGALGDQPLHEYLHQLGDLFDRLVPKLTAGALVWVNIGDTAVGSGGAGGDYGTGGSRAGRARWRQAAATIVLGSVTRSDGPGLAVLRELEPGQWAGVPSRLAAELQSRGWLLRADVIWAKPDPQRHDIGHVRRPKEQHEHVLMLSRAAAGQSRFESSNQRLGDVWPIPPARGLEAVGKAPWPVALPAQMLRLSGPPGLMLDPFVGSGNSYHAAERVGWRCVGIDADPDARADVARRFRGKVTVCAPSALGAWLGSAA